MRPGLCLFLLSLGAVAFAGRCLGENRSDLTRAMRQNFEAVTELQSFILHRESFSDPKSAEAIRRNLKVLGKISHVFPKAKAAEQPAIAAIAALFSDRIAEIQREFSQGRFEAARRGLLTISGFCFECHSRHSSPWKFDDLAQRVEKITLSPFEKADFFAATHQLDKALPAYDLALKSNPKGESQWIEYANGLRNALAVTVRTTRDASATLRILNEVGKHPGLPPYLKREVDDWRKDAARWKAEPAPAGRTTGAEKVAAARGLLDRAGQLRRFPHEENGDVSYLRATALLHEALEASPKAEYRGEALYLLGIAYHALQDPLLWDLDGMYFEACVREFPHTLIARDCFRAYGRRTYLGYTGSGGTFLPEDEEEKLADLDELSRQIKPSPSPTPINP